MNISEKFNLLWCSLNKGVYAELPLKVKINLCVDFLWNRLMYKTYLIDYLQYQFFWLNRRGKSRFIEYQKLHKIMRICNDENYTNFFDDNRNYISTNKCTFGEFVQFVDRSKTFFVKPRIGSFGKGTKIITINKDTDLNTLFTELKNEDSILEEVIIQHKEMARFNKSSVNTLRVTTLVCADGSVKVVTAVFRVGRQGKVADNFHHYGLAALIDLDTGIVMTPGVDRDFNRFVLHPDSKVPIVGFTIPNWELVLEVAKKAAMVIPEVRYVGWDICINEDGIPVIIEGNYGADVDVTQVPDLIGKWHLFESYVEEIKRMKMSSK